MDREGQKRVEWSRPEPFGAWVRLDDQTLVAVDHGLAQRLGVESGQTNLTQTIPGPLEAHVSVTSRCFAPCTDCYLDARPDGAMPSREQLQQRIVALANLGASTVAFGGGEPLLRDDLGILAKFARSLGLVPVMTTSGFGLSESHLEDLSAFAQINVSHDGVGGAYAAVRGFEGARAAERAITMLAGAGIAVGANVVITRQSFEHLRQTAETVADLGAGELQLLRFKPQGRAARLEYLDKRLSVSQVARLWNEISQIIAERRLSVRIDCALVPLLSDALNKLPNPAQLLTSLGVFGCEAGRYLTAVDVQGHLSPCSFSHAPMNGSTDAWQDDEELVRFRAYHVSPDEPCRSCELFSVCRGGCQIVSRYSRAGAFGADPECPQVMRHRDELGART